MQRGTSAGQCGNGNFLSGEGFRTYVMVVFEGNGDLGRRKLIPALFRSSIKEGLMLAVRHHRQ